MSSETVVRVADRYTIDLHVTMHAHDKQKQQYAYLSYVMRVSIPSDNLLNIWPKNGYI